MAGSSCPQFQRPGDKIKGLHLEPGGRHWQNWDGESKFFELTLPWKPVITWESRRGLQFAGVGWSCICRRRHLGGRFLWDVHIHAYVGFHTKGVLHRETHELSSDCNRAVSVVPSPWSLWCLLDSVGFWRGCFFPLFQIWVIDWAGWSFPRGKKEGSHRLYHFNSH